MKKFFLMLAVALPMFFATSCGDDNDESLTLDQTNVTIDYQKTLELKASEKNGTWASTNDFVASVDQKGKVTANHEGVATISYNKDGKTASCKVTVNATNDWFSTITQWGVSTDQVKNAANQSNLVLLTEQDGNLMYTLAGNAYPWYGFFFTNNSLSGSSVYFTDQQFDDEDFNGYLAQRYQKIETKENGEVVYANSTSLTTATESAVVAYEGGDDDLWSVTYVPVTHTKAGGIDFDVVKASKELLKAARK